jgi:hypothetical protein
MNQNASLFQSCTRAFVPAAVAVVVAACGAESSSALFSGGASSGAASSGGGSSGGTFGTGDGGTLGGGDARAGDGGDCSAPVDMFIMFDRSGSMGADCKIGDKTPSKWCRSINALSGYLNSKGATNQAAALQFFPLQNHTDVLCSTGENYQVAALPSAEYQALPSSIFDAKLDSEFPGGGGGGGGGGGMGGTPTEAAIRGLTRFTASNRRPGRVTIGILITDGDPRGCSEDLSTLSGLLAKHYTDTKVRTYVIGMQGASFSNLETIAKGGNSPSHPDVVGALADACGDGAGPCTHWNVGDGDAAAFTAALAAIQESADGCKPGGGTINPR